jgi:anti-sigma regulatory factor (Ser/Thr protein kinase)
MYCFLYVPYLISFHKGYKSLELYERIKHPARIEYLQNFIDFVATCSRKLGFEKKRVQEIELATEEALVNIFNYAYKAKIGDVEIICKLDDSTRLIIEIVDTGVPFNVFSDEATFNAVASSKCRIGGRGVALIKRFMDEVQYRHEGQKNILSLIVEKNR